MNHRPDILYSYTAGPGSFEPIPPWSAVGSPPMQQPPSTTFAMSSGPTMFMHGLADSEAGFSGDQDRNATSMALVLSGAPGSDGVSLEAMSRTLADQEVALAFFGTARTSARGYINSYDEVVTPTVYTSPAIEHALNNTGAFENSFGPAAVMIPTAAEVGLSTPFERPVLAPEVCGGCPRRVVHPVRCSESHVFCTRCILDLVEIHMDQLIQDGRRPDSPALDHTIPCLHPGCSGSLALAERWELFVEQVKLRNSFDADQSIKMCLRCGWLHPLMPWEESIMCDPVTGGCNADIGFIDMRQEPNQVREYNAYPGPSGGHPRASLTSERFRATPYQASARQDTGDNEMRAKMLAAAQSRMKKNNPTRRVPTRFHRNVRLS
ncbi:hypothetical protein BDN72DRAFT_140937 [Pluteus cervinus]|uniref:Uncharacterized protein n=1 Tax=Pluteus cervinus TaxID=181527 RepID=A0ACD3AMQ1_9AGAR|nr:hypothetical protein BDN72DRAFT_140937 [Pluteus cervinus]